MIATRDTQETITQPLATDLKAALENLERLANELEIHGPARLSDLDVQQGKLVAKASSPIRKGVNFAKTLLSNAHATQRAAQQQELRSEVERWTQTVRNHFHSLNKWRSAEEGADRQKAHRVLSTIRRFNRTMKGLPGTNKNFFRSAMISVPPQTVRRRRFTQGKHGVYPDLWNLPILNNRKHRKEAPTRNELDAFRMKAASLIQSHNLSISPAETLAKVRERPINVQGHRCLGDSKTVVSLSQEISPFPGVTVRLQGAFRRDPESRLSIPIPDSFQLMTESKQTGFPHPSQQSGWSLGEHLLPDNSVLPRMQNLLEAKWRVARGLSPGGKYLNHAKKLLSLRRSAFLLDVEGLLRQHQAIVQELLGTPCIEIGNYYEYVRQHPYPFRTLCQAQQMILERYIGRPFQYLEENRLLRNRRKNLDIRQDLEMFLQKLHTRQNRKIARETDDKRKVELQFIHRIGQVLGPLTIELILYHQGSKLGTQKGALSPAALRLEAMAIRQLMAFVREIQTPELLDTDTMKARMQGELEKDLFLLQAPLKSLLSTPEGILIQEQLEAQESPKIQ